jgi:hypothetical protein
MHNATRAVMMLGLALAVTGRLCAQRPSHGGLGEMFGNLPSLPGLTNPTVGSGSDYLITAKGKESEVAMVALGKEDVDGATGYWMEMRMTSPDLGGEMVMKTLNVTTGTETGVKRMIMQQPGKPPVEMDGMLMSMMQQHQPHPTTPNAAGGNGARGELVGTETVTVPAGTFTCQHYRNQGNNGTTDMWISTDITPYAMVKMTSAETTMVLKKVLTNEASHIKGEPQKMQMPQMPHF